MPRLVFIATTDPAFDQRMIRICGTLARRGHRVLLIGRVLPDSGPLPDRAFQQMRLRCFFRKGKLFYLEYNVRLLLKLLFLPFDVVCAVDLDTIAPAVLIARLRRKYLVYDAHEYFTEVPELLDRPVVKHLWEKLAHWAIPKVDRAYTVGTALARVLSEKYHKPFQVIRNIPYAYDPQQQADKPNQKIVLYQGALNAGRGLEQMLEALQYLPDVILWLAGSGDLTDKLKKKTQDLGLGKQVVFLGKLLPDVLKTYTPRATIGLNLLENRSLSYYYSLANKAFDYVQAGIPSIQMDFPEYRTLNEAHACFVLLTDLTPERIAHAITQLLEDRSYYLQLRQNCLLAAQEWNWENEEAALAELYDFQIPK